MTNKESPTLRDRFQGAFIDVEEHMRKAVYGNKSEAPGRFRTVLEAFAQKHGRHLREVDKQTLITLSELRNLLAHNKHLASRPVAVPSVEAVEAIEKIRQKLLHPSPAMVVLNCQNPVVVRPDALVAATVQTMHSNNFSQVPVYDGKAYKGLLTTNTVARWMASQMQRSSGMVEDGPVSDALRMAEKGFENVLHRSRSLSVPETIWEFTHGARKGTPVTAIILTNSGRPDETPLGLIVVSDLARLPD